MDCENIGWYLSTDTQNGKYVNAEASTWEADITIVLSGMFKSKYFPFVTKVAQL
jgi:hypothetical protein